MVLRGTWAKGTQEHDEFLKDKNLQTVGGRHNGQLTLASPAFDGVWVFRGFTELEGLCDRAEMEGWS